VSIAQTVPQISAYLVLMWAEPEMLHCLTRVLRSSEQDDIGAGWCTHSELIKGDALTTSLLDASTGSSGEAECADGHLGDLEETVVVSDSANHGADLALVCSRRVLVCGDGNDF
jgi:hypothetical protein